MSLRRNGIFQGARIRDSHAVRRAGGDLRVPARRRPGVGRVADRPGLRVADGHRAELGLDVRVRAPESRGEPADPRARPLLRRKRGGHLRRGARRAGSSAAADKYGFLMVVPQTSQNCWDVATTPSLTHDGGGDTQAIVDMVKYAITKHNANANRVYVIGHLVRRHDDAGAARRLSRRVQGRRRVRGRSGRMLVRQRPRRAVERPVRGRSGHAHRGGVGDHGSRHVPRLHRISPPHPALARDGGQHHQLHQPDRGHQAVDQRLGLDAAPDGDVCDDQRPRLQSPAMEGLLRVHGPRRMDGDGGPHGTDANMNATYAIPFFDLDKSGPTDPQSCGGDAGTSGGSKDDAGSNGAGGSSSNGAGGSSGGNSNAGESGGSNGTGGNPSSGTSMGTGGLSNSGTAGDIGSGGSSEVAAGSDVLGGSSPSRPGCSCRVAQASGAPDAFAWAAILAVVFGRRRRTTCGGSR